MIAVRLFTNLIIIVASDRDHVTKMGLEMRMKIIVLETAGRNEVADVQHEVPVSNELKGTVGLHGCGTSAYLNERPKPMRNKRSRGDKRFPGGGCLNPARCPHF
jgi:hypothetical protein